MVQRKKVEHLVVDTSAFIKNAALQEIGINIVTEESVMNEITSKRQLKRLVVLPYDLKVKEAFPEDIKVVSEFAKKTGDYTSLSATDVKVMALTYRLHVENAGKDSIKLEPTTPKIGDIKAQFKEHPLNLAGFYNPKTKQSENENTDEHEEQKLRTSEEKVRQLLEEIGLNSDDNCDTELNYYDCSDNLQDEQNSDKDNEKNNTELKASEHCPKNDIAERFATLDCDDNCNTEQNCEDILIPIKDNAIEDENSCFRNENEEESDNESENHEDDDDEENDDEGWITPQNIRKVKNEMESDVVEDEPATVACLTMDFAMQNVLKQMGLHVVTLDGKVIKQLRTFILRCYACFKTTSIMTKVFCPHCGLKTLKKVSVALNDKGELQMFINYKKPLSARGKRYSLPTPKGGKHSNNPILREDQPMPDQRPSKLARQKNNPLNDDWIAGYSPFVTRDVNSKAAMLGIRPGSEMKYWMRRNPNEVRRKSNKKK